jgi:hypothetical protein
VRGATVARRTDFTEEEWDALTRGVTGTALVVAAAEGGPLGAIKEARAFAQHLRDARETSGSALVHDLVGATASFRPSRVGDDVERETVDAVATAVATLAAKAPDELEPYRALVRGIAAAVAGAAGQPSRLERAALRLADADSAASSEDAALARIEAALGGSPND